MKSTIISKTALAAATALAVSVGTAGVDAQTKTNKPTKPKTVKKAAKKPAAKGKPIKPGAHFVTYYNTKWSQASSGKCGKQYRLYTASEKKAAKGQTKKLYTRQMKLCGRSYWATKRAATCASSHKRARHTAVLRRYVKKGSYKALCPRGAQAQISKAAAQRKANFKKKSRRKPVRKSTKKDGS